ncbi:MAG: hypothetical protein C0424_00805 [Sphingobacteriaceae bacterium]|nr:hypothetical protein [Sphingobacteriaceae bacterium]
MQVRTAARWLLILLLGSVISSHAQTHDHRLCGQDALRSLQQQRGREEAILQSRASFDQFLRDFEEVQVERTQNLLRIPVVVHVMHAPGEAYGVLSNITDEQVYSQIEVLNEDFRRLVGSRGFNNSTVGADTELEFCLATRDPAGQATTGIVRVPYSGSNNFQLSQDLAMKNLSRWPTGRYLNIWIVKSIQSGILGYAYLPADLAGDPQRTSIDGLVIGARYFGSREKQPPGQTFNLDNTFGLGRTATHEIGHYLNLLHTWGDGGCEVDDGVGDTPLCSGQYFGCPPSPARPTQCGFSRMVENYMDYSDDACFNIFTQGQKTRMRAAMQFYAFRASLSSQLNLIATGCADTSNPLFADTLLRVAGNEQIQRVNRIFEVALQARVLSQLNSGFNNVDVRFQLVDQPTGSFKSLDTTLRTAGGGFANVAVRAGSIPGNYRYRASANTARGGEVFFDLTAISEALAYPNPFESSITLKLEYPAVQQVQVQVYDLTGRRVHMETQQAKEAVVLQLGHLANQFYFVTTTTPTVTDYFKIIKIAR